jgi:hypothetical protein
MRTPDGEWWPPLGVCDSSILVHLPSMWCASGEMTEDASGFCWEALTARVLHPVDVQIVEAFQWIAQPLSANDLRQLFDDAVPWSSLRHHIRRLAKLNAIELDETPTIGNITDIRYRLVQRPRNEP